MQRFRLLLVLALTAVAMLPGMVQADKIEVLKEEPPKESLRHGQVVCVDDGTCPAGEVKEITGGNTKRSIPRKVRCIKRPD